MSSLGVAKVLPEAARLALMRAVETQKKTGSLDVLDVAIQKVKTQYPQYFNHEDEKEFENES